MRADRRLQRQEGQGADGPGQAERAPCQQSQHEQQQSLQRPQRKPRAVLGGACVVVEEHGLLDPFAFLRLFLQASGRAQVELRGHPCTDPQFHQWRMLRVEGEPAATSVGGPGHDVPGLIDGETVQPRARGRTQHRQQGQRQ
jgi:hypothetical protein